MTRFSAALLLTASLFSVPVFADVCSDDLQGCTSSCAHFDDYQWCMNECQSSYDSCNENGPPPSAGCQPGQVWCSSGNGQGSCYEGSSCRQFQ